jgi:hypothetical protein
MYMERTERVEEKESLISPSKIPLALALASDYARRGAESETARHET